MTQIDQPLLALDPAKRYAGFRTVPARKRGMSAPTKTIFWMVLIAASAFGIHVAVHGF